MEPLTAGNVCPHCGYANNTPYLPAYLAPGTVLNERYLVGRLLSYNGEAANYIGYDSVTNKKIVVKEYMPDTLCSRVRGSSLISVNQNNLAQYKTFMSEFTELNKVLAKMRTLNHINPALELFAENNTTYVIFDQINGVPLKTFLQENAGELAWEEIKKLFPPIFTTISLIHNEGIIHRGISPETIWFTNDGDFKLTGFSITAERTANTELAPELFTGYAAPEQYSSSNWQGTWTDVYAISAVLYRMLTGCMPTDAVSRIGNDTLCEPALINTNIPINVSRVIMEGLRLSGDMRIQTVTELVTKHFEQPDYLEQGMSSTRNNTGEFSVTRTNYGNSPTKKNTSNPKLDKIRIPVTVFIIVIVILGIAAAVAIWFMNSGEEKGSDVQTSVTDVVTTPAAETPPVTTKPAGGTVVTTAPSEMFEMQDFLGKPFELIKTSPTYDWIVFKATSEYNDEFPKGQIFKQSIPVGERVLRGHELDV
ncbi:MAG: protein kinase, partial [Oscillospiraceae bacterium]